MTTFTQTTPTAAGVQRDPTSAGPAPRHAEGSPLHWSAGARLLAALGAAGALWALVAWAVLAR
jgi:hypothetical protein